MTAVNLSVESRGFDFLKESTIQISSSHLQFSQLLIIFIICTKLHYSTNSVQTKLCMLLLKEKKFIKLYFTGLKLLF